MNMVTEEIVPKKEKSKWLWIAITILFVLSSIFTVFLISKNVIAKTNQNEIYTPEPVPQVGEKQTYSLIQLDGNDKTLLVLSMTLLIIVGFDRKWQGQSQDTFFTIIAIVLMLLGGYIEKFIENSLAVMVASLLIVYLAAFLGKLDFSAPGGFWGSIAIWGAVFGNFGALQTYFNIQKTSLLSIQEVISLMIAKSSEYTIFSRWIYSMIIISGLHFLLELMSFRLGINIKKRKISIFIKWNIRWIGVVIAFVMTIIPFILTRYTSIELWLAMITTIGMSSMLVASKQKFVVGVKTNEEDFASATVGRVMLQSQWDGIAFGIILNAGIMLLTKLYV